MAHARAWWLAATVAVPTVLAAFALPWVGSPVPAAPSVVASAVPPTGAAPAASSEPVVAVDPTPAEQPDPTPAGVAEALAAQPIRFTADSAELAGPAAATVQRVAEVLVSGRAVPVLVEGYVADTPGGPEAVQQLSDRRAAVVAAALVAAGVPAERITTRGLGATKPLATAEDSRRVEITIG